MKISERVMERRFRDRVTIDEMQMGFMPGKGTVDTANPAKVYRQKQTFIPCFCRFGKNIRSGTLEASFFSLSFELFVFSIMQEDVRTLRDAHALFASRQLRLGHHEG